MAEGEDQIMRQSPHRPACDSIQAADCNAVRVGFLRHPRLPLYPPSLPLFGASAYSIPRRMEDYRVQN